jgi:hypothetical protein
VKKTDEELRQDIKAAYLEIHNHVQDLWTQSPSDGISLRMLESHANALAIYCKLLRQRLEAKDPSIQHLRATLAEDRTWPNAMPIHVHLKLSDVTQREGE